MWTKVPWLSQLRLKQQWLPRQIFRVMGLEVCVSYRLYDLLKILQRRPRSEDYRLILHGRCLEMIRSCEGITPGRKYGALVMRLILAHQLSIMDQGVGAQEGLRILSLGD